MEWFKIRLTSQDLEEIKNAEKQVTNLQLLKRLQCIKLKNEGWKHDQLKDFFGVCIDTITNWLKAYKQGGIQKLLEWNYQGKISILTTEQQNQIRERHKEKPFDTAKEAKAYIEKEFGIVWHLHWVQKLLKKNFDFHTKNHEQSQGIVRTK